MLSKLTRFLTVQTANINLNDTLEVLFTMQYKHSD